jgi:hypothetical protein
VSLAALFSVLTAAFAAVAVWTGAAGQWLIAACAAALAFWLGSIAFAQIRRL